MTFDNLLIERDNAVAIVTLNRPKVLNALNSQTLTELARAMAAFKDDAGVRAIVLTGAGDKSFVAGADINELAALSPVAGQEHARHGQQIFDAIEQLGKPVIAAINGFALGGGCELAMACDFIYASRAAKLGQPEINLGILPGWGGTQRLARATSLGFAKELVLTGRTVGAEEAERRGLVNAVYEPAELRSKVLETARLLARKSPVALAWTKEATNLALQGGHEANLAQEASLFAMAFSTEDQTEGMSAFVEKREPEFRGR
jgi:enoyl-CoA hydratase